MEQQSQNLIDEEDSSDEMNEDQNVFDNSESMCSDLDGEFCKRLLEFKHRLYSQTVLKPETHLPESQEMDVLNPYLNSLEYFRAILVPILTFGIKKQTPPIPPKFLSSLPADSRSSANELYNHVVTTVQQNQASNRQLLEAYTTFIDNMFHVYPFLMNNEFS